MDNKIPSDEQGEFHCSDLDVPLLKSEILDELFVLYFSNITLEQWMFLSRGQIDFDTAELLSELCCRVVERVYSLVLNVVAPQVNDRRESARITINTSVSTCGIEDLQTQHNYDTVTVEDIKASLGDILHQCIGKELGVVEESTDSSENLLQLVAESVAQKVNRDLAIIRQSTPPQQSKYETSDSPTIDMVFHVAKIIERCLTKKSQQDSQDDLEVVSVSSEASSPDEESTVEEPTSGDTEGYISEWQSADLSIFVSPVSSTNTEEEFSQGEKTFFSLFLAKLLDHIACSTQTSVLELDFEGLLKKLRRAVGDVNFPLPQSVGNLHHSVFKKLCVEFGSAKLLQASMASEDMAFFEATARELTERLQKPTRKPFSFVRRRCFRRKSNKVAPASEVDTLVSQTEVVPLENGSTTPKPKKQMCPAINRIFSAVARSLRKTFTSGGS